MLLAMVTKGIMAEAISYDHGGTYADASARVFS